jgi:hypothetical protein
MDVSPSTKIVDMLGTIQISGNLKDDKINISALESGIYILNFHEKGASYFCTSLSKCKKKRDEYQTKTSIA